MENLYIKATQQTPEINFQTNGNLFIKGVSTPDLVKKHYQPMFDWLLEFKNNLPNEISLTLEIDYLNTSSSIIFVDLFVMINSFKSENRIVNMIWRYEEGDEDMVELGEHLKVSSKSNFNFIEF